MAGLTLLDVGLALVALAAAGLLARRVGQSVIPAYLLVGMLLGPHAPALWGFRPTVVADPETVSLFADLGVVLLLFFVGLELSLDALVEKGDRVLAGGAIDVGVSLPLGFAVGVLLGFDWVASLVLAGVLFNSSTVIVAKLLLELDWIANPESEAILAVVVVEDVATAGYLAVLSAVLLGATDLGALATDVAVVVALVAAGTVVALRGTNLVERLLDVESGELFVLLALGVAATVAGLGEHSGVSAAVAAFLVGTAVGRTSLTDRVEGLLAPSRDLFAALFFLSVGLATDPALVTREAWAVAVAVAVTIPGQYVSGYYAGRQFDLEPSRAFRVGSALAPRGEFALVIAALAASVGTTPVLTERVPAFTVGYVLATSVLGTFAMRYSDQLWALLPVADPQ
ncbi:cation:proton antiporter [Halobacterium hubeiense]|uniref:cation:proton antiporter n=1 Tax=Halobacterium hubeiense TaxID=1407499 RepID=UPI003C739FA1